jgi:beta-1,4-mannosyl-glycoprotein beta-1,4-N-acetylglucosaminyltransferase
MLIDAFTFLNEFDMLEDRLKYLDKIVDYFVIVECDHTFAGNPKGLNFPKQIGRYRKYLHKIMYLPFSINPIDYDFSKPKITDYSAGQWLVEKQQRNYMMEGLKFFHPESFVLIGDIDEIVTIESIKLSISKFENIPMAIGSNQELFMYNFKQKGINFWNGTIMAKNHRVMEMTPEWFRTQRSSFENHLYGYHMTYFMETNQIKYKIQNFSHQELNQENFTDEQLIEQRIAKGIEPFERQEFLLIPVEASSIDSEIYRIFNKVPKT